MRKGESMSMAAAMATDRPTATGLAGGISRRSSPVIRVSGEVANARVTPQRACPLDDTEPTTDRADMAHGVRYGADEKGDGLKPAKEVAPHEKRPRCYHTSSMCGPIDRRVSVESAIEESEDRRRRLMVELGEIEGVTTAYECASVGASLAAFAAGETGEQMRAVLHQRTRLKEI